MGCQEAKKIAVRFFGRSRGLIVLTSVGFLA